MGWPLKARSCGRGARWGAQGHARSADERGGLAERHRPLGWVRVSATWWQRRALRRGRRRGARGCARKTPVLYSPRSAPRGSPTAAGLRSPGRSPSISRSRCSARGGRGHGRHRRETPRRRVRPRLHPRQSPPSCRRLQHARRSNRKWERVSRLEAIKSDSRIIAPCMSPENAWRGRAHPLPQPPRPLEADGLRADAGQDGTSVTEPGRPREG